MDFTRLRTTGATDRNLGAHLDHLARAGYVEVTKAFVGRRPRTTVKASAQGRSALAPNLGFLRSIIEGA
ncbi:MAG TPA: transcriptional regulator [Roseiarcus sp.]